MKCIIFLAFFALLIGCIDAYLRPRIIGGQDAETSEYPYQASLRFENEHFCGGTIISARHILTAAHCITEENGGVPPYFGFTVKTGGYQANSYGNHYRIAKITIHPQWSGLDSQYYFNDIAVITLEKEIDFNQQQQKIDLPTHNVCSGMKGILTGWGRITLHKRADKMQKLEMTLLTRTDCRLQFSADVEIHEKQICAYYKSGHGSCFGDSGGPIAVDNQVVGIVSWVLDGVCASGKPEVHTNVFAYKDFIESIMLKDFM